VGGRSETVDWRQLIISIAPQVWSCIRSTGGVPGASHLTRWMIVSTPVHVGLTAISVHFTFLQGN